MSHLINFPHLVRLVLPLLLAVAPFAFSTDFFPMCFHYMKIRGVNYCSPQYQFIPCGKCDECRDMIRGGWSFRLRAELQDKCINQGWHAGFITLTYNDEHLPTLPQSLFNSYDPLKQVIVDGLVKSDFYGEELHAESYDVVKCFDREDVRQLVHGIRKYLWKHYDFKGLVYAIAGEYGSHTKRPHYHGLFCWPSFIPDKVIYSLISDYWRGTSLVVDDRSQKTFSIDSSRPDRGFICPRNFDGYGSEKPFVVADPLAAANYASKYLCKDVGFANYLGGYDVNAKCKAFKRYNCFHVQSRSLGLSILNDLTDDEKFKLYSEGFGFVGEKRLTPIPVYIKNKLFFTPHYTLDSNGKRLVTRLVTPFFRKNYEKIYEKKVDYYERLIQKTQDASFWLSRFTDSSISNFLAERCRSVLRRFTARSLAQHYLSYYGVPFEFRYDVDFSAAWANRYSEFGSFSPPNAPLVSRSLHFLLDDSVSLILGSFKFSFSKFYTKQDEIFDRIKDFWSST